MSMEKRALLAIVISMGILLLTQPLIVKYFPQQKHVQKVQASVSPGTAPASAAASQIQKAEQPPQPAKQADEKDIIFENEEYRAVLSNAGGVIKSATLKKHLDSKGNPMVLFDESNPSDATFAVSGLSPAIDKAVFADNKRCVPIIISILPCFKPSRIPFCSPWLLKRESAAIFSGKSLIRPRKF